MITPSDLTDRVGSPSQVACTTTHVTRAAFNEAVHTYMDAFGMTVEEATVEVEEEFRLRGLVSSKNDVCDIDEGELNAKLETLARSLANITAQESPSSSQLTKICQELKEALNTSRECYADVFSQAVLSAGLTEPLLVSCKIFKSSSQLHEHAFLLLTAMLKSRCLSTVQLESTRFHELLERLVDAEMTDTICDFLIALIETTGVDSPLVQERICVLCIQGLSSKKHFEIRSTCRLIGSMLRGGLKEPKHDRIIILYKYGLAARLGQKILELSRSETKESMVATSQVINTLAQFLVRDDICRSIDASVINYLEKTLRANDKYTLSAACKCARRLVMSDSWRHVFLRSTAALIDLLASTEKSVIEHAIAILASLSLRNAATADALAESGVADKVLAIMQQAHSARVQRQCCILLRNIIVRNADIKVYVKSRGAEELLRQSKVRFPKYCTDVASAALRDLGCENYNENWTISTPVMGVDGRILVSSEIEFTRH